MLSRRRIELWAAVVLAISSTSALAQDEFVYEEFIAPQLDVKEGRTVLFTPKYIDVRELQSVLELLNADIEVKPSLNLIAARSADEEELATLERIITTLDVAPEPKPNVELAAYVLAASEKVAPSNIPPDLSRMAEGLTSRFGFGSLRLLDTIFLRVDDGSGGRIEGSFPLGKSDELTGYQFHFDGATVAKQDGAYHVRLEALTFAVTGDNPAGVQRALIRTNVEVDLGQKMMVGKATPRGTGETLVLLIEAGVQSPG